VTRHRVARTAAALLLAGVRACGGGRAGLPSGASPAASPAALEDLLASDVAADQAFAWSAARRLTWSDFQGVPPAEGAEGARTAYTLYYAWRCRGATFEFLAIAGFRPRQSWVKRLVVNDPAQSRSVLAHEQTHFDLTEVHARGMRRHFAALAKPCRKTDGELTAVARRLVAEEKAEQRRYDDETNHGVLAERQAAWSRGVAQRLAASRP